MKKWLIISISLIVIIIVTVSIYAYNSNKKYQEDKKPFSNFLINVKCLSLCPIIELNGNTNGLKRFDYDPNCMLGCQKFAIKNNLTQKALGKGNKLEDKYNKFNQQFLFCYNQMNKDKNSDYEKCFNDTLSSVKDINDVSGFTLPEYTNYAMEFIDLKCGTSSANATIVITNSDQDLNNLIYVFQNKDGSTSLESSSERPILNEIKSYIINYPIGISKVNLESIGIVMNTTYGKVPQVLKDC